jgi:hypothetical protein
LYPGSERNVGVKATTCPRGVREVRKVSSVAQLHRGWFYRRLGGHGGV